MSLIYEIMISSSIRPISAGSMSDVMAPPSKIDPVNLKNGNHERDEMTFDKKIIQRHRELDFKHEPGSVNSNKRKVGHDPYNVS